MQNMEQHAQFVNQLCTAAKVPESIKLLPEYSGNKSTLSSWLVSAQAIVDEYEPLHGDAIWARWLGNIRQKIVGQAHDALSLRGVNRNWLEIKAALIEYFGDRRDLSTLQQEAANLQQGDKAIETFYREALELQVKITEKIHLTQAYNGHAQYVAHYACDAVKNSFIDGLNPPYSAFTRNANPESLANAFQIANQQFLANARQKSRQMFAQKTLNGQRAKNNSQNFTPRATAQNPRYGQSSQVQGPFRSQNFPQNGGNGQNNSWQPAQVQAPFRPQQQNFPQNRGNFQNAPAPRNNFAAPQVEADASMRTHRSVQPMSVSANYRRNDQIMFTETDAQAEVSDDINEAQCDEIVDAVDFADDQFAINEANFLVAEVVNELT